MTEEAPTKLDFSAGADDYQAKLQLAPVVDLVLFLIWFYLLVGQLVVHQKDAQVALPEMTNAMTTGEVPAELVINIRADSKITLDGTNVTEPQLRQRLLAEQAKAGKEMQAPRVVVRADKTLSFGRLDEILRLCRKAGFAQVVFRSVEGEP